MNRPSSSPNVRPRPSSRQVIRNVLLSGVLAAIACESDKAQADIHVPEAVEIIPTVKEAQERADRIEEAAKAVQPKEVEVEEEAKPAEEEVDCEELADGKVVVSIRSGGLKGQLARFAREGCRESKRSFRGEDFKYVELEEGCEVLCITSYNECLEKQAEENAAK